MLESNTDLSLFIFYFIFLCFFFFYFLYFFRFFIFISIVFHILYLLREIVDSKKQNDNNHCLTCMTIYDIWFRYPKVHTTAFVYELKFNTSSLELYSQNHFITQLQVKAFLAAF